MSQHSYEPENVEDPNTYSMALLWMNYYAAQDPETLRLREQFAQQCRDAGIGDE